MTPLQELENVVKNGINVAESILQELNVVKKENVSNKVLFTPNVKEVKHIITMVDVETNGNNVEEKIGKELLAVKKDHV